VKSNNNNDGRFLLSQEQIDLENAFGTSPTLKRLFSVLVDHPIIGCQFDVDASDDNSGMGVSMKWLDPKEQIEEAFEFYPGIAALSEGYIPIGECLFGSGDPYFLKMKNEEPCIFRIPHEAVDENDHLYENKVEFVSTLDFFLKIRKNK